MNISSIKKNMARDTILYLPAKVIEGIVGMLTIRLYTSYFDKEIFGYYTYISTNVNVCFVLLISWLVHAACRYVNVFDSPSKKKVFLSTSFGVLALINGVILIIGLAAILILKAYMEPWLLQLVLFTVFMCVSYSTTQMMFSMLGTLRRVKLNLALSIFSITAKLLLTTVFVYTVSNGAKSPLPAIISNILIDMVVISVVAWRLELFKFIRLRMFSKKLFRKFLHYSIPLMGVSITVSLLNLSDRYVINPLLGPVQLAEYSANYSIASAVFSMIIIGVMRGVYPLILKTWKQNNIKQTEELLTQAVRYFLIIALPAVVGLSTLVDPIATYFLGRGYFSGRYVIAFVGVGMLFLGLTEYANKAWELTANNKPVFRNSLISGIFNLISNIVFIPIYGYYAAAVNTALAYILYFVLAIQGSRKVLTWHLPLLSYIRIIGSSIVMGAVVFAAVSFRMPSPVGMIWLILLGALVYAACLYLSWEIEPEVKHIAAWARKFKAGQNHAE